LPEGPRDLPDRQRTLRATIDWSYRLLEDEEQALLEALSPFVGGVRIDSAEAIWGEVSIDRLISLAEKSLLGRREDPDRESRFWMLETVREFAIERAAASGSIDRAAALHAEHYYQLVEHAAPELEGREQRIWVVRLEHEHPNLRVALDYLVEHDPTRAVRMAAQLEWFWVMQGYAPEGLGRLTHVLERAPTHVRDRGGALAAAGQLALQVGDAQAAEPLLVEALALARRDGDEALAAHALSHLGWWAETLGDNEGAERHHLEAVASARTAGDGSPLGIALNNYGVMNARRGNLKAARPLLEESLQVARRQGQSNVIALAGANLATLALETDQLETADRRAADALARAREIGSRPLIAGTLGTQAEISLRRDEIDRASSQIAGAIDALRSVSDLETVASLLSLAGTLAAIRHQPMRAATLWAAADQARERVRLAEAPNIGLLSAKWQPQARASAPNQERWTAAQRIGAELSAQDALELAIGATNTLAGDIDMKSSSPISAT
jgi:tetratricopeptide (TPR) repeat protein